MLQWHLHPCKCVTQWFMHEREKIAISLSLLSPKETKIWSLLPFLLSDNRFSHVFFQIIASIFLIQLVWEVPHSTHTFCPFGLWHKGRTKILQTTHCCRILKWSANSWIKPRKQLGEALGYYGITSNSSKACVSMDFQVTMECSERFCHDSK